VNLRLGDKISNHGTDREEHDMLGNTEHDEPDATSGDDSLPLSENGLDRSKLRDGKRGLARSKRIARAQGSTRTRKILRALVPSVALILVIAVPTMVVEEDWHGRPMIEQGNLLWLVPAAFVVLAFFLGGRLMGKRTELSTSAPAAGAMGGIIAATTLLFGGYVRRHWILHEVYWADVIRLWIGASIAAIAIAAVGAWHGRRSVTRSKPARRDPWTAR
jgi:hypothetical protein